MAGKVITPLVVLLLLLFVAAGDKVLPGRLGQVSFKTRTTVISALNSMVGKSLENVPVDTRYGRTDDVFQEFECADGSITSGPSECK
jgi:hypothetical protein